MFNNYICALDISSSKISAVVAEIKKRHITSIFFESLPSEGIREGMIVNSIDLVGSLSRILKNLKAKSGINIKFIYTNISGGDIITKRSRAIIPLAERGNKVITLSDVEKVNDQARILGSSLEEEIIHSIPLGYTIDSKNNILNPLGLYSHRLEVDLYLICARSSSLQSLTRAINQAGYEIKDLFFSSIATSRAIFDKETKEGINILCDIGSDITELIVYRDGLLKDIQILPFGGNDLTLQLSEDLKIPWELAEDVKRSYASVGNQSQLRQDQEVLIKKSNLYKPIKQKLIAEIVTSKTKLVCEKIKEATEKATSLNQINTFVTTGRSVLLEGFLETLENTLGIPCKLGRIVNPEIISFVDKENALSGQKYFTYITALGIICEALSPLHIQYSDPICFSATANPVLKLIHKAKEVYQEYF